MIAYEKAFSAYNLMWDLEAGLSQAVNKYACRGHQGHKQVFKERAGDQNSFSSAENKGTLHLYL